MTKIIRHPIYGRLLVYSWPLILLVIACQMAIKGEHIVACFNIIYTNLLIYALCFWAGRRA